MRCSWADLAMFAVTVFLLVPLVLRLAEIVIGTVNDIIAFGFLTQ